jgi:acetyl-CoA acetyltransferase
VTTATAAPASASAIPAVVGVGQTEFSRSSGRSVHRLAAEAVRAACADAGIAPGRLDGVVPFVVGPPAEDIAGMFGLENLNFALAPRLGGASAVGSLEAAMFALRARLATYVVVYSARNGASGMRAQARAASVMPGAQFRASLEAPHGISTPGQWYSMIARRHMHEFGTTREHLGSVALTMRRHAQLNPRAQMHGRELTMDTYLGARMIADPYLLFDCCLETDGAAAVVLTTRERADDGPHPVVELASAASARASSPDDLFSREDFFDCGLTRAAPRAFREAALTPADVDVALIYDCFTFELIHQLEEAGFCARGEGGPMVADGSIALSGRLPVNPHGGLLSEGHVGGMNHVVEAVAQLRGGCGERQVAGAEIAAVTGWGDLGDGAFALLRRG